MLGFCITVLCFVVRYCLFTWNWKKYNNWVSSSEVGRVNSVASLGCYVQGGLRDFFSSLREFSGITVAIVLSVGL